MSSYIQNLIKQGEHLKQDFKFEINDVRKIARTLVAFSNTEGGKLLVGVKDNGKISGIHSDEELFMIEAAAKIYCKPEVSFQIQKWQVNGKTILEVDIPKGATKPYLAKTPEDKWLAYIRVNDENFLVNAIQLRVWKMESRKKGVWLPVTSKEKQILEFIDSNVSSSLEDLCYMTGLSRKKTSDVLVKLISIRLVRIIYSGDIIKYQTIK